MANHRIFEDRVLTDIEKVRRQHDKAASIDTELDEAFKNINWERRNGASKSLLDFIMTYGLGTLLDDPPSDNAKKVIMEMDFALKQSKPYQICLPRGSGKTSYVELATMYLLAYGLRKFAVIISQNARSATNILKDCWRLIVERDTAFAIDFPELCLPFQVSEGSFRRRQLYQGTMIEKQANSQMIELPKIKKNGKLLPNCGGILTVKGLSSGIRGLKVGRLRPDICICDDWQTAESADNPDQIQKMLDLLHKDVMNLSSKGKMALLFTATPIQPDDLVEQLEHDVNWKTSKFKAIIRYPNDLTKDDEHSLWKQYFKMFDNESIEDLPHTESLQFYKDHREEMDEGSELFNPDGFKLSDGHISGLQAILEKRHLIGEVAFDAEYQMKPRRISYTLVVNPKYIKNKQAETGIGIVPDGFIYTIASSDLNLSKYITTTIWSFKRDMTAICIYHALTKCNIDMKLSDAEYNKQTYNALIKVGKKLVDTGIKIDGWAIDANGVPFNAVIDFCKASKTLVGIKATGFIGKASHVFSGFVRSRLRNEINRTVLCGDANEQVKSGAGKRWTFFDSDFYREMVQRAMMAPTGITGGATLYAADQDEHDEFAKMFCGEQLQYVKRSSDGRNHYTWKTKTDHDYLDSSAQAFACVASIGVSGSNFAMSDEQKMKANKPRLLKKRKIVFK